MKKKKKKKPLLGWNFSSLILTLHPFGLICLYEYAEFGGWETPSLSLFSPSPSFFSLFFFFHFIKRKPLGSIYHTNTQVHKKVCIIKALVAQVVTRLG